MMVWWLILLLLAACSAPLASPQRPTSTLAPGVVETQLAPIKEQPTSTPEVSQPQEGQAKWVAYVGTDGNVRLVNPASGAMEQITSDGTPIGVNSDPNAETVFYHRPVWSSDGKLLAFKLERGRPIAEGYQYEGSLLVYNLETREARAVLEDLNVTLYAWMPGTHVIAYGMPVDPDYFASGAGINPALSRGIWTVDADTGEVTELVKPEAGYHLTSPQFTQDGQIISFDEILYMEGRGNFAYFDLASRTYVRWDRPIGNYQWSRDGKFLFYDYLTYAPSGRERIFMNTRDNSAEQQISPTDLPANTIAFTPALSPAGDQVAYVVEQMGDQGRTTHRVFVQPVSGGQPRDFGQFENPTDLSWSSDGQSLVFSAGPYEARQVMLILLVDGASQALVQGTLPAWQP